MRVVRGDGKQYHKPLIFLWFIPPIKMVMTRVWFMIDLTTLVDFFSHANQPLTYQCLQCRSPNASGSKVHAGTKADLEISLVPSERNIEVVGWVGGLIMEV